MERLAHLHFAIVYINDDKTHNEDMRGQHFLVNSELFLTISWIKSCCMAQSMHSI